MVEVLALLSGSVFNFQATTTKKTNVVLSGEAMKEMQKQAKANKDERRMAVSLIDF